ncbi:MAG: glycosyltransferase family 1 protein [Rhodothermales bacterium]|nr:glycosyltransferase family 1 protein [Rhodothermales bacterium]
MRRLNADGHRVSCASPGDCQAAVTAAGFPYVQLTPNTYSEWSRVDKNVPWVRRLMDTSNRRRKAIEALGVERVAAELTEMQPDLVLIDRELHEHIIIALSLDLPLALTSTWFAIWRKPRIPPPHKGIIPGQTWKGSRAGIELYWRWLHLHKTRLAFREGVRHPGADRISVLKALANLHGVKLRKHIELYQWQIPFSYKSLPLLCLRSLEMEFPHKPPRTVHYMGPMINPQRVDQSTSTDSNAQLESILSRHRRDGNRVLIYCGFGSFFKTIEAFLYRLFEAAASRPDWDLIVPVGEDQMRKLGELSAENVHCFDWVPQLQVLGQADLALVHGGVNTIAECVHFGVPMIVYNQEFLDMPGNTARVVYHGIGVEGDIRGETPEEIRAKIDGILENAEIKTRVTTMRDRVLNSDRDKRVEDVVHELLAE